MSPRRAALRCLAPTPTLQQHPHEVVVATLDDLGRDPTRAPALVPTGRIVTLLEVCACVCVCVALLSSIQTAPDSVAVPHTFVIHLYLPTYL